MEKVKDSVEAMSADSIALINFIYKINIVFVNNL